MKSAKTDDKMSLSHILRNYFYAAKLMLKYYPLKFVFQLFFWTSTNILNIFSYTYLLRFVVNGLQSGERMELIFRYVLILLVSGSVVDCLRSVYDNIVLPIIDRKSQQRLDLEIFRRSLELDLENYENPEAFELYERAVTSGAGAIQAVIGSIGGFVSQLTHLSLEGGILYAIDPFLFVFVGITGV